MFNVNQQAADYIRMHGNLIAVDLKFKPAIGDILCVSRRLEGCYIPKIHIGDEISKRNPQFYHESVNGIMIYYHPELKAKIGCPSIRLVLRRFLFWQWLELEGAKITPVFEN